MQCLRLSIRFFHFTVRDRTAWNASFLISVGKFVRFSLVKYGELVRPSRLLTAPDLMSLPWLYVHITGDSVFDGHFNLYR
jgi:hypothetical protein